MDIVCVSVLIHVV